MAKKPDVSIELIKKGKTVKPFSKAIEAVAISAGIDERTVKQHYGVRKLPPGRQYMGVLEEYIKDGRFIDSLKEHHPDDADRIEQETRHLYN